MAIAQTSNVFGSSLFAKLHTVVEGFRFAAEKRAVYARTYDELNALSDADLTDIGIGRGQIADLARAEVAKLG